MLTWASRIELNKLKGLFCQSFSHCHDQFLYLNRVILALAVIFAEIPQRNTKQTCASEYV